MTIVIAILIGSVIACLIWLVVQMLAAYVRRRRAEAWWQSQLIASADRVARKAHTRPKADARIQRRRYAR